MIFQPTLPPHSHTHTYTHVYIYRIKHIYLALDPCSEPNKRTLHSLFQIEIGADRTIETQLS